MSTDDDAEAAIVVDGMFFQLNPFSGIARVWSELLPRWRDMAIGRRIVIIDRGGTLPKFEGLRTVSLPVFNYQAWRQDPEQLQEVCDTLRAGLFISTYYTRPARTPAVLLVHDMIPEKLNYDLRALMWQQKHDAIRYASAFAAVSRNSLSDLREVFPETAAKPAVVTHPGVSERFSPISAEERRAFHDNFVGPSLGGRPYLLFVSDFAAYKNAPLFFQVLQSLPEAILSKIAVLFTNDDKSIEGLRALPGLKVHVAKLTDRGLRLAYGAAHALVYPSRYEGFGLPILEAMACGCPVICANSSSIPEVAGEAALLIDPDDAGQLRSAILHLSDAALRQKLRLSGLERAKQFSWDRMAASLADFLVAGWRGEGSEHPLSRPPYGMASEG